MLDEPSGIEGVRLDEPAHACRVASVLELRRVPGEHVVEVALEPALARITRQMLGRLGEPALERELQVATQVGAAPSRLKAPAVDDSIDEGSPPGGPRGSR